MFSLAPRRAIPKVSFLPAITVILFCVGFSFLAGCGAGTAALPSNIAGPAMQGAIMGGEIPVAGAQVTLWETDPGNTGYGAAATVLAGPVTSSNPGGNFSFTTGYTCSPSQFVYITATGGDVSNGGGTINLNLVLIAALGSCSNFSNATSQGRVKIIINELSTVAAAYALGNFTTVNENGSNGTQKVYIGAPAANNASAGSCSGAGSSMTCTSAGLAHAFANAANLVDAVRFDSSSPTGAAYATVPGNSLASVPQAEINLLGNIVSYCTNSAGGAASGTSGASDGTPCGNFFANTKPFGCSASSCAPQDTLSATIDLAKYPSHNVSTLVGYSNAQSAFQPALTAAGGSGSTANLALAITYTGISSNFGSPEYLALDANDDVYVLSGDFPTSTQGGVAAMTSSGSPLWNSGYSTSFCTPRFLATDTVGNVWATNYNNTSCTPTTQYIVGYSQASGATSASTTFSTTNLLTSSSTYGFPNGIAVDKSNNLWYTRLAGNCTTVACVFEIPYSAGASTGGTYTSVNSIAIASAELGEVLLDANQNVWFSSYGSSSTSTPEYLSVVPNLNAATPSSAPSYPASSTTPFRYSGPGTTGYSYSLALDSSNNAWSVSSNVGVGTISELTTPLTSGVITGNPSPTGSSTTFTTTGLKPYEPQFDGNGQLWFDYYNTTTGAVYFVFNPLGTSVSGGTAQTINALQPCYAPAGASSCTANMLYSPRSLQIDSTGSVWVTALGSATTGQGNGVVAQIIGTAYPTWPQLSYAKFGVQPQ